MTQVPPTTARELGRQDDETGSDETCGAEMSDGSTCDRPVSECPYDSHRGD